MSDEAKIIPTWGYSRNHIEDGAKIFDLKEGESLPEGYYDHPSKVPGTHVFYVSTDDNEPEAEKLAAAKSEKPVLKLPADKP